MLRRSLVVVVLAIGAACGGSEGATGPTAQVTAPPPESTTTTEARTPEQEVEAAYLRSWDVYAKAVRDLDPSGLEESFAGSSLSLTQQEVAELEAANTPIVVQVTHEIEVQFLEPDEALVRDRYVNRNYRIDGEGNPIDDPDDPGIYVEISQMKRIEGTWRVVSVVRESYQP